MRKPRTAKDRRQRRGRAAEEHARRRGRSRKNDRFLDQVKISDTEPLHLISPTVQQPNSPTAHQPNTSSAQQPPGYTHLHLIRPAAGKTVFIIHSRTRNNGTESYIRFMKTKDFKKIKRKNPLKILNSLNFSNRYIEKLFHPHTKNPQSLVT